MDNRPDWIDSPKGKDLRLRKDAGFTIIELLIVMAIFGVLTGIGGLSYLSMRPGLLLNGATRQVQGDLMAVRMGAVHRNRKFKVFFINDHEFKRCNDANNDGSVDSAEGDVVLKNIQNRYSGVTISATADPEFFPRGTSTGTTVTLSNTGGTKSISVGITGRVKIN